MKTKTYQLEGYNFNLEIDKVDKDWYEWKISLDEQNNDLNKIEKVEYILHPTYKNRIQVTEDPQNGFKLDFSGYDGFKMPVNIYLKEKDKNGDNEEINLLFPIDTD